MSLLTREDIVAAYCSVSDKEWAIGGMEDATPFARAIEAAVIRKQAAEIERLKAGCDLAVQQAETLVRLRDQDRDKANALLRQALEALEKTRAFHQQDWSSEEITPKLTRDTIAAIKQHLGEV